MVYSAATLSKIEASFKENYMANPNADFSKNFGHIHRLYPDTTNLWFSLKDGQTAMQPQDGYYFIPAASGNYQTLAQLVYLCAEHGWVLKVRAEDTLVAGHAKVAYLVVDL